MTSTKYISYITTITVFVALFSIIFQGYFAANDLQRITTILTNLVNLENIDTNKLIKPKIAIGYGSCSDVYVNAVNFLNYTENILDMDEDFNDDLNNIDEVLQSFAYYFQHGAAAERYTSNSEFFRNLIRLSKFNDGYRYALGGNAPVMAIRFLQENGDVLLAAQMSEELRRRVPSEINLIGDPVDIDDIHFIMEYKANDTWGPLTAPRANRYILHNDHHNPLVSSLEPFHAHLLDFNPRLLVISGLQMMDNFPYKEGVRESRIQKIRDQISTVRNTTLVHFEMASFVEIQLLQLLIENVLPYTDSIGMNEQEVDNLAQVLESDRISVIANSNPRVASILSQMRSVFKLTNKKYFENIKNDNNGKNRMLSRIHVHSLAFQAFMIVKGSTWKNTKNAAAKASLTAYRHVCGTTRINPESAYLKLDDSFSTATEDKYAPQRIKFDIKNPVSCWNETIFIDIDKLLEVEICLAPVLVCRVASQTVGAGDNISAAGLILQI